LVKFTNKATEKLFRKLSSLSCNLHTLDLASLDATILSLFKLTFPKLLSLTLYDPSIDNPLEGIAFWDRHPTLEYLDLRISVHRDKGSWFPYDLIISPGFLPNLKYLKCHFNDARVLTPILHQLKGMAIYGSINAQVPYLLRSVLPDGLPNLKSLFIYHRVLLRRRSQGLEGALWCETEDGTFWEYDIESECWYTFEGDTEPIFNKDLKTGTRVWRNYVHSIVRGAPNLEEFGFNKYLDPITIPKFPNFPSELGQFSNLRRFYYRGAWGESREGFLSNAIVLGGACSSLDMVVSTSIFPYTVARILRNEKEDVSNVVIGKGYGMQIGSENEAFSWNWM